MSIRLTLVLLLLAAGARTENLLVITLDTTRRDHLSCYGATGVRTPALDALAARGTLFARAYTPVPVTFPAHVTLFSGLNPPATGARGNVYYAAGADLPLLAPALQAKGFDTRAFVSSRVLDRRFGLDRGFARYDQPEGKERTAEGTVDAVLGALSGLREPFFLWVHLFDPHDPYAAPEPFRSRAASPYAAEVEYMDAQIGRLLEAMESRLPRTWVVAVADHGEMLFERGEPTHGYTLFEPAVAVPLILVPPGGLKAPEKVDAPVTLADLAPTLRRLFNLEGVPSDGLDLFGDLPAGRPLYLETWLPFATFRWAPWTGMVLGHLKYMEGARPHAFRLGGGEEEITGREPAVTARLGRRFSSHFGGGGRVSREAVPASLRAELMSLGYLAGSSAAAPEDRSALPHPLDMLDLLVPLISGIEQRFAKKDYDGVLAESRAILKRSPENLVATYHIAKAHFMKGEWAPAARAWEHTLKYQEGDPWVLANLALCHARMDDPQRAEALYRSAIAIVGDDPEVLKLYGLFLVETGRPAEAAALFPVPGGPLMRRAGAEVLARAAPALPARMVDLLWEAVRRDPDTLDHARALVGILLDRGDEGGALRVLEHSAARCSDPAVREEAVRARDQLKELIKGGSR